MAIQNRYELMYYVACTNANPNGDPDMGNTPRIDPQTMQGFISDGATKRRIRDYVVTAHGGEPGMEIIVQQATNLNRHIARAKREAGFEDCAKGKDAVYAGRRKACELFYDVRTFGAVMSTGPNAGQVRGPVQFTFGKSLDPVLPLDISITRMAIADGGELIVLAPGVDHFGEDPAIDRLIRKYGYCGRLKVLEQFRAPENQDLRDNMGAAAHLIHGSSDGRFSITYAVRPHITREEIEGVHFKWADYDEMAARYDPRRLSYGYNILPGGEEVYFIPNPALGLWIDRSRFQD